MEKCHCSGVSFQKVIEICIEKNCHYSEAAKLLDVSETCTACRNDLKEYCENRLRVQKLAS